jgi:hypothetical protein
MNKIYETGKFPVAWKTSVLHLIYKGKGHREDPGNYRGTALLSTLSKIFTGVLAKRLNDWIENRGEISECQMGFRKGRRTTDNIFIIRTIIDKHLARKRGKVCWMFVDLEKAFDTVVREFLWWKLRRKGVSAKSIEAIRGMYSNAKISVKLEENRITQEFDSTEGLRQVCALSPALFNIYMNGILSKLDDANIRPPTMRNRNVPGFLFTDDLAVGTTTGIGMQRVINSIKEYCEE